MDVDRILELLRSLPFRQAVWLFPLATALHFLEEAPHFTDWATMYAWAGYTRARWKRVHGVGMIYAVAFSALVSLFPNRHIVFLFFALCFSESIFNSLFHTGATAIFGVYCPGLITALILYPPLFWYLNSMAYYEGLLTNSLGLLAFAVAGVIHTADVATSVFGVEWSSFRRAK
jgi:hypothetical protein